jgi:hypothetical protein
MISRKMLITMFDYSYFLVNQSIQGITHQESLLQAPGGGNPVNWILGHIITSRCNVLAMLKVDPPWDFSRCKPYVPDSKPIAPGDLVENFEIMKTDLEKTQEVLLEVIQKLNKENLEEKAGEGNLGEELAGYEVHEAYHAGQIEILKQILKSK